MKHIRKVLIPLLAVVMCMMAFTGCEKTSSQIESEAVEAIREATLESIATYTQDQFAAVLTGIPFEQYQIYAESGNVFVSLPFMNDFSNRWKYFVDNHGECVEAVVDETLREEYEYTSRIIMTGEDGKQMAMTIFYDKNGQPYKTTIADYVDESNKTFGDKMAEAGGNTIIGLATVFAVLILLALIIYCFRFVNAAAIPPSKKKAAAEEKKPAPVKAAPAPAPVAAAPDPMDDLQLIAVITAAIAAAEDKPAEGFVVRSIRRAKTNKWR